MVTVAELVALLQQLPPDACIAVRDDDDDLLTDCGFEGMVQENGQSFAVLQFGWEGTTNENGPG